MAWRKRFHRFVRIHFGDAVELRFEAALQEKIGEALDEFLQVHAAARFARVFCVADVFRHTSPTIADPLQSYRIKNPRV
jgi:hypothetical protein